MTSKKYIAVDPYNKTSERYFLFVMQKMTEFEVVTQELSWIQQIRTDLLELEPFDDFVSIFPLTALQELLDNKEKAKDFVEHDDVARLCV